MNYCRFIVLEGLRKRVHFRKISFTIFTSRSSKNISKTPDSKLSDASLFRYSLWTYLAVLKIRSAEFDVLAEVKFETKNYCYWKGGKINY